MKSCWLMAGLCAWLAMGCAPRAPREPIGYDHFDKSPPTKEPEPTVALVPEDVVARAAGPVRVIRLSDGTELAGAELSRELLGYDALCAGEEHTLAQSHYAEFWLLNELAGPARAEGLELGAGFEMWSVRDQSALNSYFAGRSDEATLVKRTRFERRWGYSFAYYRPLLARARELAVPLVALNAPPTIVKRVAERGLDGLKRAQRSQLPELDLNDAEHRADFDRFVKGHPGIHAENIENYYAAQVVWDESMADTAARWLARHAPVRRLLVFAGAAHCRHGAIPNRIERRGPAHAAALLLAAAAPKEEDRSGYDYAVIRGD